MYIIELLNNNRLKNEILQLVYEPFKEKIVGSDKHGWPDWLHSIEAENLIYKKALKNNFIK